MGNHDLLTQVSRHTSGHSAKSVEYAVHPASAVHGPHVCPAGRGDSPCRAGHAWHVGTQTPRLVGYNYLAIDGRWGGRSATTVLRGQTIASYVVIITNWILAGEPVW